MGLVIYFWALLGILMAATVGETSYPLKLLHHHSQLQNNLLCTVQPIVLVPSDHS